MLTALQQAFPPLLTLLCALQSGGMPAVLQGPCGAAAAALMAAPAGEHLLHAFAELAGNEPLLKAALQHYQDVSAQQQHTMQQEQQQQGPGLEQQPQTPPPAAAAASAASNSPIPVRSPALGQALQQLQASVAEGEVSAAVQLMCSLSVALELAQQGRDTTAALESTRQQLQQQQHLASDLQQKLRLVEQQQEQMRQQTAAAAAAAATQLQHTKEQLEQALLCQICFERNKDCLLLPCMHFLYCQQCIAAAKTPSKGAAVGGGGAGSAGVNGSGSKAADGGLLKCPVCRVPCSGQLVVHLSPV